MSASITVSASELPSAATLHGCCAALCCAFAPPPEPSCVVLCRLCKKHSLHQLPQVHLTAPASAGPPAAGTHKSGVSVPAAGLRCIALLLCACRTCPSHWTSCFWVWCWRVLGSAPQREAGHPAAADAHSAGHLHHAVSTVEDCAPWDIEGRKYPPSQCAAKQRSQWCSCLPSWAPELRSGLQVG